MKPVEVFDDLLWLLGCILIAVIVLPLAITVVLCRWIEKELKR